MQKLDLGPTLTRNKFAMILGLSWLIWAPPFILSNIEFLELGKFGSQSLYQDDNQFVHFNCCYFLFPS